MEDHLYYVMFGIMVILEIILLSFIVSKLRREKEYAEKSVKMKAEVRSVTKKRIMSRYMLYTYVVKAENGKIYIISSSGLQAFMIRVGDTVDILVPEGAHAYTEEDEYFESICIQGEKAIKTLSYTEKIRLKNYLDEKQKEYISSTVELNEHTRPYLASDGGGLRHEIICMGLVAAVIAVVVVLFTFYRIVPLVFN